MREVGWARLPLQIATRRSAARNDINSQALTTSVEYVICRGCKGTESPCRSFHYWKDGGVPQILFPSPSPTRAGEGDREPVLSLPKEGEGFRGDS